METKSPIAQFRAAQGNMSLEAFGGMFSPPVHKSTVMRWERKGVPIDRLIEVEKITRIKRVSLRPDLFANVVESEAVE